MDIISKRRIEIGQAKIQSIMKLPNPTSMSWNVSLRQIGEYPYWAKDRSRRETDQNFKKLLKDHRLVNWIFKRNKHIDL